MAAAPSFPAIQVWKLVVAILVHIPEEAGVHGTTEEFLVFVHVWHTADHAVRYKGATQSHGT